MIWPLRNIRDFFWSRLVRWLTHEDVNQGTPLSDFDRMRYELRPGDVILVEGRSNVSDIIKSITQSVWTHSMLYIGHYHNIDDETTQKQLSKFIDCSPNDQIVIESLLGQGTIADTLDKYRHEHLRICRPRGLTRNDAQRVISYAINQLGTDYNVRQLMDLFRFMFPYWWIPRRWRSTLFEHNAGRPTKTVCSAMMAEAFASVHFPIKPVLHQDDDGIVKIYRRHTQLITPPDFDYSPYFDVIKYPLLDFDELAVYRQLPWDRNGVHAGTSRDYFVRDVTGLDLIRTSAGDPDAKAQTGMTDPVQSIGTDEPGRPSGINTLKPT